MLRTSIRPLLHSPLPSVSSRYLSTTRSSTSPSASRPLILIASAASVLLIGTTLVSEPLKSQSSKSEQGYETQSQLHKGKVGSIKPSVFLWGRNSYNVVAPTLPDQEVVKKPKLVKLFDGVVLRDLVLSETYGAAVDAKGDVLQWGTGFSPSSTGPVATLRNRDIVKLTPTEHKLFGLSKKGEVFVVPSDLKRQQRGEEKRKADSSSWKFWAQGDSGSDVEKLSTDVPLKSGEKFVSISAGTSHLLALTSHNRSFALPLSLSANTYGQLGVRNVTLLSTHSTASTPSPITSLTPDISLNDAKFDLPPPPTNLNPLLLPSGTSEVPIVPNRTISTARNVFAPPTLVESISAQKELERDIRFATVLHEIPSLRMEGVPVEERIQVDELVAGENHSLARLKDGRVLGWGANGYGQLGLGPSLSYPLIPAPTEIPLGRCYSKTTRVSCSKVAAGANLSYFVVDRVDIPTGKASIDLLATGNGQFGGIGNGSWAHAASPVRVKTISGLLEWSDKAGKIEPIAIKDISVGNAHLAIVLDNAVEQPGGIKFGRDVYLWGHNLYYQLGSGKRSNLSTPQHLAPLPYPGLAAAVVPPVDATVESGTTSPMPHSRLQLAPEIKYDGKKVEEAIVAGDGASGTYWRILSP